MKPKFLWFRITIGFGVLLGLLLLVQTLLTYRFVSRSLIHQEASRDAVRRVQSIGRLSRQGNIDETAKLGPILNELIREDPDQIAWIRILNFDGKVLASGGNHLAAPAYKPGEIGKVIGNRERVPTEVPTPDGKVVVALEPLRLGGPPGAGRGSGEGRGPGDGRGPSDGRGRGGRRPPEAAEIGLYLSGISTKFGPLQTNLIIGLMAAIALLVSMLIIGLSAWNISKAKACIALTIRRVKIPVNNGK